MRRCLMASFFILFPILWGSCKMEKGEKLQKDSIKGTQSSTTDDVSSEIHLGLDVQYLPPPHDFSFPLSDKLMRAQEIYLDVQGISFNQEYLAVKDVAGDGEKHNLRLASRSLLKEVPLGSLIPSGSATKLHVRKLIIKGHLVRDLTPAMQGMLEQLQDENPEILETFGLEETPGAFQNLVPFQMEFLIDEPLGLSFPSIAQDQVDKDKGNGKVGGHYRVKLSLDLSSWVKEMDVDNLTLSVSRRNPGRGLYRLDPKHNADNGLYSKMLQSLKRSPPILIEADFLPHASSVPPQGQEHGQDHSPGEGNPLPPNCHYTPDGGIHCH